MSAEHDRIAGFGGLEDGLREASDWYLWGPYLSERQWGTVREDYSEDGDAWNYFPHDHARSRAYRWGEDGLAGFSDVEQRLCLGLALWNGRDQILKERIFGLAADEGNHGEDAKEYWWYLDALPSHAWNRWRYHYPQAAFPYEDLIAENGRRGRHDPEYELLDTGVFDEDRYWIVEVHYAKADPADLLMAVSVTNAGPDADRLHVLPTAWFRNTWSWDACAPRPVLAIDGEAGEADPETVRVEHPFLGTLELIAGDGPGETRPQALFCENETNARRLWGAHPSTLYPKDGINDHVIRGAQTVNPDRSGTKCAFCYKLTVQPGETVELRLRLRPAGNRGSADADPLGAAFGQVIAARRAEADEFYARLTPGQAPDDEAMIMRQAFAGMLWSKQFYNYDVKRWLEGDPTQPPPPQGRRLGRNSRWRNFSSLDIMSMPDKWEYPWFSAWDLAFHCVSLAHVDPAFAKYQLQLVCREWFQHPGGALPAYERDFGDVNPPVQAWAALEVFALDGARDPGFLGAIFDKLLVNFTWWVNREDARGNSLFDGGSIGLDNIGPIDRSRLPADGVLEQSDAAGWMAFYAVTMGRITQVLHRGGHRPGSDLTLKFLEHFAQIGDAIDGQGMWDDGLYYDRFVTPDGDSVPLMARSVVGMIPLLAAAALDQRTLNRALSLGKHCADAMSRQGIADPEKLRQLGLLRGDADAGDERLLLPVVGVGRLDKMLSKLFDPCEFLSPYGLRTLSAYHRHSPFRLDAGGVAADVGYEPAESTTNMFGGNSNWRGPLWFPLNHLVISCLERYHEFLGDEFTVEYPAGSGRRLTLRDIAQDLRARLISIFTAGEDGRRPCFGEADRMQHDPAWKDNMIFSEYFNGDNAAGLGASHQTGWTGLVADMIRRRHGAVRPSGVVIDGACTRQARA